MTRALRRHSDCAVGPAGHPRTRRAFQGPDLRHHGERFCRFPAARGAPLDRERGELSTRRIRRWRSRGLQSTAGGPPGRGTQPRSERIVLAWQFGQKGRFDTVYITASSEQQNLVAPIVASLLSQIREAAFARYRADEGDDCFSRPPVLWALDEVAGIAPYARPARDAEPVGRPGAPAGGLPPGPQMARARWDKAADAFLTLFGNIVIHPGIRDDATLRAISTVSGKSGSPSRPRARTRARAGAVVAVTSKRAGSRPRLSSLSTCSIPAPWPKGA